MGSLGRAGLALLAQAASACTGTAVPTTASTTTTTTTTTAATTATPADPCGPEVVALTEQTAAFARLTSGGADPSPIDRLTADPTAPRGEVVAEFGTRATAHRATADQLVALAGAEPEIAGTYALELARDFGRLADLYAAMGQEFGAAAAGVPPGAEWSAWDELNRELGVHGRVWAVVYEGPPVAAFPAFAAHLGEHCPELRDQLARAWQIIGPVNTSEWGRWDRSTLDTIPYFVED